MLLYHGSNMMIEEIDLAKSRPYKDFGKAFYLSEDIEQAREMAKFKVLTGGGKDCITAFDFDDQDLSMLKVKRFERYTEEWAEFVYNNRDEKQDFRHDFDLVYGPIANDKVGLQISRYQLQYIPMEELIRQLSFIRPTFQYFFGTERAIRLLHKI